MDEEEREETGLNTSDIEHFLELNKKEIMDHIMDKLFKDKPQIIKISGETFDRLVNQVTRDVPFGTMIQFALANAIMYSLWSGFQSERLKNKEGLKIRDEYIEQIQDTINKAFNIGRNYASERQN